MLACYVFAATFAFRVYVRLYHDCELMIFLVLCTQPSSSTPSLQSRQEYLWQTSHRVASATPHQAQLWLVKSILGIFYTYERYSLDPFYTSFSIVTVPNVLCYNHAANIYRVFMYAYFSIRPQIAADMTRPF